MHQAAMLQVVIPFHQPVDATDADIDAAVNGTYLRILDALSGQPTARVGLHVGGTLLDHLVRRHEDVLFRLKGLVQSGQVEILGGLFYGGLPALLPESDVRGQIEMTGQFWESYVGAAPTGLWLPELAWCAELPRLLQDTGLSFGFVAERQIETAHAHRGLAVISRGDRRLPAFVLDEQLSRGVPFQDLGDWSALLGDRARARPGGVVSLWVRAESLGLEPGTAARCDRDGWLARWFERIATSDELLRPTLPSAAFGAVRPAAAATLVTGCAPELGAMGTTQGPIDWPDFIRQFVEVDAVHRRMLRVSAKLGEAIARMEDEGLEETWSDALATAQRLVFSAQGPDAYWRGAMPGCTAPGVREATLHRLVRASAMIDGLVQGEGDWIADEEADSDGDLQDEIFVSTRLLDVWIDPSRGAAILGLDDRKRARALLDVGVRREEPFRLAADNAPREPSAEPRASRGEGLRRLADTLPLAFDRVPRRTIRTRVFDERTSMAEYDETGALELVPSDAVWQVTENRIDEEGDCSFNLVARLETMLAGVKERRLVVQRRLQIPIDAAEVTLVVSAMLEGAPEITLATEFPLRLASARVSLTVNGLETTPGVHQEARTVRLTGDDGEAVELTFAAPCDVWVVPVESTLRTLEGYAPVGQGFVVVPVVSVASQAEVAMTVRVAGEPMPRS